MRRLGGAPPLDFGGRQTSGGTTSCAIATTKLQNQRSPRPKKLWLFESAAKRAGELGVYAARDLNLTRRRFRGFVSGCGQD